MVTLSTQRKAKVGTRDQTCKKWQMEQMPFSDFFRLCGNVPTYRQQNKGDLTFSADFRHKKKQLKKKEEKN